MAVTTVPLIFIVRLLFWAKVYPEIIIGGIPIWSMREIALGLPPVKAVNALKLKVLRTKNNSAKTMIVLLLLYCMFISHLPMAQGMFQFLR